MQQQVTNESPQVAAAHEMTISQLAVCITHLPLLHFALTLDRLDDDLLDLFFFLLGSLLLFFFLFFVAIVRKKKSSW